MIHITYHFERYWGGYKDTARYFSDGVEIHITYNANRDIRMSKTFRVDMNPRGFLEDYLHFRLVDVFHVTNSNYGIMDGRTYSTMTALPFNMSYEQMLNVQRQNNTRFYQQESNNDH